MRYDPERHRRRSIRLKDYDYTSSGAYFVTICTHDRACFFGTVVDGEMELNDAGRIARSSWNELAARFSNITTDVLIVMPNHIHGIILVGAQFIARQRLSQDISDGTRQGAINRALTLGEVGPHV